MRRPKGPTPCSTPRSQQFSSKLCSVKERKLCLLALHKSQKNSEFHSVRLAAAMQSQTMYLAWDSQAFNIYRRPSAQEHVLQASMQDSRRNLIQLERMKVCAGCSR